MSPKIASKVSQDYWALYHKPHTDVPLKSYEVYYNKIVEIMKPKKNETILDAGCGGGEITYLFHRDGFNIKGFDSSEYLVANARRRFGSHLFYVDDLINMGNCKQRFTKVFLNGVFLCIHPAYYKVALRNLFNITEDNGIVYLFGNPDYSRRNRLYRRYRAQLLNFLTLFLPIYNAVFSGFWVKTKDLQKIALNSGFSKVEKLDAWVPYKCHHILFKSRAVS